VVDWVMRVAGVGCRHAVERLKRRLPSGTIEAAPAPTIVLYPDVDDATLMREVIGFFHRQLVVCPEALAYLGKRGLVQRAMIDHFQLGYVSRTLGDALPHKQLKAGAALRGRPQALGLLRGNGHEHFTGSIVVPVLVPSGEVTEVYGRTANDHLREWTPYHLYLPGPHRGVWNEPALQESIEGARQLNGKTEAAYRVGIVGGKRDQVFPHPGSHRAGGRHQPLRVCGQQSNSLY
jgi:hypothetical protein